jgi:hypothetical protein
MEENMKHQTKIFGVKPIQELKEERMKHIRGGVGMEDPPPGSDPNPDPNPNNNNPDGANKRGIQIIHIG